MKIKNKNLVTNIKSKLMYILHKSVEICVYLVIHKKVDGLYPSWKKFLKSFHAYCQTHIKNLTANAARFLTCVIIRSIIG